MLVKIVELDSYSQGDEPSIHVVTPGKSLSGMTKKAAHADIDHFVTNVLTPSPGKFYLHINAMGAGEYYGSNKNGDYFPEEQLIQHHKTFETHGHVFRHHINDDPAKSIGKVLFATYNHDMHRVEVVEEVDAEQGKDILARIARGDYPSTSMACKTPWDECSICGNRAHNTASYCSHLRTEMNKLHPDGRKTMALNKARLNFFDMSFVLRPADVTSSALRKVASVGAVPGAFLAEEAGMGEHTKVASRSPVTKAAAVAKMSALIKKIPGGIIMQGGRNLSSILKSVHQLQPEIVSGLLRLGDFNQVMNAMAELKLTPSLEFLAELIAQATGSSPDEKVGRQVGELIPRVSLKDNPQECLTVIPEVSEEPAGPHLMKELSKYVGASSLTPSAVEKRAYFPAETPFGYVPPPGVQYGSPPPTAPYVPQGPAITLADRLLAIAGGALVARFLLHSLVSAKSGLKSGYDAGQVKYSSAYPVVETLLEGMALSDLSRLKNVV